MNLMKTYFLLLVATLAGCAQITEKEPPESAKYMTPEEIAEDMEREKALLDHERALLQKEQTLLEQEQALLEKEQNQLQREQFLLKREVVQVKPEADGVDPVSEAVAQMAVQLNAGLQQNRVKRFPVAVIPFVDLHENKTAGPFGERLGESFIFQLQQHGYNLVDYRAVSLTTSTKQPLSKQNLSALRVRYKIYFILTGTYAQHPDGLVLNARVLDTTTRQVLASGQTHIPNVRLEGALPGYDPLRSLNKGMIIENSAGPVN